MPKDSSLVHLWIKDFPELFNNKEFCSKACSKVTTGSISNLSVMKGPTRTLKPSFLHEIFENIATTTTANKIALIFEENGKTRKYTYSELNTLTNRLSWVIRQIVLDKNLPKNNDGDFIVAVSMHPSDNLVITLLAIWKAGAAYLALDPTFPKARIEHILRESKPVIVIFDEDVGHFVNTCKLSFEEFLNSSNNFSVKPLPSDERLQHTKDNLAIVLYTSGSTGVPKGVRLSHTTILNRLQWQFKTFPYSKTETTGIFKTTLTFVDSVSEIWGPLLNGLSVLVVPKIVTQNPEKLVGVLEGYKIERLFLVPSLLRSLLLYFDMQKGKRFLQNLRTWVCSGETLVISLAKEFYKYFPDNQHQLCNFYGSTEIMGDVTFHVISGLDQLNYQEKVPIGQPVDNTIVYLLDSDFCPVKAGEVGELFVSGSNLSAGYVNGRDPERFIENPLAVDPMFAQLYRTGDFARVDKGTLLYEGRTDSQVKIRGYRVDLAEVEKAVNDMDGVDKAVALCYKPGEMNQAILAFVTTEASLNEHQIEMALQNKLPSYMVPQVILIENIPLLINGKTDRQALLSNYDNVNNTNHVGVSHQLNIDYTGVPESQMEAAKVLFETVASVLNRSARSVISMDANFYEIGGNSLNSIFTITSLSEKGYHISIGDFIVAIDLGQIVDRMSPEKQAYPSIIAQPPCYNSELLQDKHKKDAIDMITTSFYLKADLEQWFITEVSESDYTELMDKLWEPLIEKQLSFVVKTESGKAVGVALCFDARDEPEVEVHSKLAVIFEFLESIEGPVRDQQLPPGKGKILHSFMMGTNSTLTPKENVAAIQFMEEEVIRVARSKEFVGIFTTNTSPLTQQLGSDIYAYKTYLNYQVNEYVASDNTKPFGMAPDSQRAIVQWKSI